MSFNWDEIRKKNGVGASSSIRGTPSTGINWDEVRRKNTVQPATDNSIDYRKLAVESQKKAKGAQSVLANTPAMTPIDQRLNLFLNNEKADDRKYIGANLIPAYEEDSPLKKVGKGIVNYGAGGVLSLLGNVGGAPQQAMMQTSRAGTNAVLGKPQQTSEMTFGKDLLGAKEDNLLTQAAATALDPATYFGGGIVDDLSRAGMMGKASRPSTEMVQVLGDSQKKLLAKMRAKMPLTQVEIETVNATPELKALPEAKQYLMLEAPKLRTPDVIEGMPVKPTLDDLDILKHTPSNAPVNKNYPNLESMDATELKALSSELVTNKEKLLQEQIKWLKETSGNGVEQGKLFRDDMGDVVGRQGRMSKNDVWYQEWFKENNRKPLVGEYRDIAEKQLREGFNTSNGYVPPNEDFNFADGFAKNADIELNSPIRQGKALSKAKQYLEAKDNLSYTVPEQYRKETPFTVVKSTVPPKVEGKYAKESFANIETPKTGAIPKSSRIDVMAQKAPGQPLPEPAAKVNLNTKKQKKPLNLYTSIVDSQNPIVKMSKETGDKTATLASNSRNVGGTVDYILKEGLVDSQGNKIGESLQEVAKKIPKGKEQSFWDYMMQRGNIDRAREGKSIISNYTPEMSTEAVRLVETANPEFKAIGDNVTGWIDNFMREWGVKAGTVDETLYSQLRETYKSYVPTQREFSELEKAIPGGVSRKFVDQVTPIKKATGSDRNIKNPIENIMGLVNRTVRTAKYNEVGQELLKTIKSSPEKMAKFAEIIPAADGMFSNVDNIVTVLDGGKPVYLRINDRALLESLEGLPKAINNLPGMRKVTGIFKSLITQKNPLFAVRNVARDIPTAYVYGSTANPIKFVKDYAGALKDVATNSPRYQKYKGIGGGGANFFKQSDTVAKDLTKKQNIFKKIGGGIEDVNNMLETAPRLAEFNRTLRNTGDIDKALFAANDVTVNFARGGNLTKSAEPLVPYLNAGVQGLDKLFRTVKDPKKLAKMLVKGGVSVTTPTVALYMVNKDNPHYKELDNRAKDNYYIIPNQSDRDENGNSKTFIKIPKSRELGVLFGVLFERALRANDGDKEAWKGFANTAATNFSPTNPIESNFFSPVLNLKSNKDFANRSIVPQGMIMDKRSPYLQYDERTSEIAKKIGEFSANVVDGGVSPKHIDYLVKSYTGVIGQLGIPLATKGGDPLKAVTTQFTSDPLYSSQVLTDFYDNYDKLQKEATDKNITEQLPTNGKENVVTKEETLRNEFSKASEQISEISKQIRRIEATSEPDKKAKVRELRQQMQDIAKKANGIITDESYKAGLYKIAIMKAPSSVTHNKQTVDLTFDQRKKYADLVAEYKKELLKNAQGQESYKSRQQEWDELVERKARDKAAKQIKIDVFRK